MAKYEYKCRNCEHVWEVEHSMSVEDAVAELGLTCPNCESTDIFKYLGHATGTTIFKGDGWGRKDDANSKAGIPKAVARTAERLGRL